MKKDSASHFKSFRSTDTRYTRGGTEQETWGDSLFSHLACMVERNTCKTDEKCFYFFFLFTLFFLCHRFTTRCREKRRQATAKACWNVPLWCGAKPYHFEFYDWGQLFLRYFLSKARLSKILHRHAELLTCFAFIDLSLFRLFRRRFFAFPGTGRGETWMSVKKTTENYMKNMPHGLTTIAIYANFEVFRFTQKSLESEIIHESKVLKRRFKITRIFYALISKAFCSSPKLIHTSFDRLMCINSVKRGWKKMKKTFTFIFVRRKKLDEGMRRK